MSRRELRELQHDPASKYMRNYRNTGDMEHITVALQKLGRGLTKAKPRAVPTARRNTVSSTRQQPRPGPASATASHLAVAALPQLEPDRDLQPYEAISSTLETQPSEVRDPRPVLLAAPYHQFALPCANPPNEQDEAIMMENKIINEEYKIWKKNAVYLYDIMYSRALDWPTLTTQWFPDKQEVPDSNHIVHRLLLGTHTSGDAPNYLQIAHFQLPKFTDPDPADYNPETEEVGGYGAGKKSQAEVKFNIVQKIDHDGEVNKARYMPQNPNLIATMCVDGRVMVFDRTKLPSQPTGTVNPQIELKGHEREGYGLHWNPGTEGQLATGSEDATVRIWDIKDYTKASKTIKATRTFNHHSAVVNDVEFHPLLPWMVATVSDDLSLQILDLRTASNVSAARNVQNAHGDAINGVSFNPGSEYILATGSADKTIGIWDLRNLRIKLHACEGHKDIVSQVDWHPTEKQILGSSSSDRRVIFWDLSKVGDEQTPEDAEDGSPELLFMHGGHTNRISDFTFNKNDPWLVCSAAEDNLLMIWRAEEVARGTNRKDVPLQELEH